MFNKALFLLFLISFSAFGQKCHLSIGGILNDRSTNTPIDRASVFLEESRSTTLTAADGSFEFDQLCEGTYHILVTHVGCEPVNVVLTVTKDTLLSLTIDHFNHALEDVVVAGSSSEQKSSITQSISQQTIEENANESFSNLLEGLSGVSTLRTGTGISKPIIHGMYGNRLMIMNNGIAQSGQQWGNDHSPEIDPLQAQRITVVKGAGVVSYQGSSLGNVILVEPSRIGNEDHLHGHVNYFFETNGLGQGIHFQTEQRKNTLGWQVGATLKKNGDRSSPSYFLKNTGGQEANFSLQLDQKVSNKFNWNFYASSFNTEMGILRGAAVGNLTDLGLAFQADVPFFTQDERSFTIEAPKQEVNHHLVKWKGQYFFTENQWLDFTASSQWNLRKEFDVRRSGRTDTPTLELSQWTHFGEAKYHQFWKNELELSSGYQVTYVDNFNNPETGILPLIPDYLSVTNGGFVNLQQVVDKWDWSVGGRFDYQYQDVAAISQSVPREILRYSNNFWNYSVTGNLDYEFVSNWKLGFNTGLASRNPAINELYSNGLHQGVSGIEQGDDNLQKETSFKSSLSLEGNIAKRLFFESMLYFQSISDYIYLRPQDEIRLTIRGAFPVFDYTQTHATIWGFDINSSLQLFDNLDLHGKYAFIYGQDRTLNEPLIFMPANNFTGEIHFELPAFSGFSNLKLVASHRFVAEQKRFLISQDFIPPPDAYHLFGLSVSTFKQLASSRLKINLKVDNLLNTTYRDYLNRQRYFADAMGRNVVFGVQWEF